MKTLSLILSLNLICLSQLTHASDIRNQAVLGSKMTKAILSGLELEQNLKCKIIIEEDGNESIAYYSESGISKYSSAFICSDARTLIVKGIIGDGGQTQTESLEFTHGS